MRSKNDPRIQEQLTKLKNVPIDKIRGLRSVVVDVPIGDLSLKNAQRAVYVLSSTLVNVRNTTNKLVEIFEKRESKIKELIEKYEKDESEIINELKELLVKEEELKQELSSKTK